MDKIDEIIQSIALPIQVPDDAFVRSGNERHMPDIDLIIDQLPPALREFVNWDATALHRGRNGKYTCFLQLIDGHQLKIKVEDRAIIELARMEW